MNELLDEECIFGCGMADDTQSTHAILMMRMRDTRVNPDELTGVTIPFCKKHSFEMLEHIQSKLSSLCYPDAELPKNKTTW